MKKKAALTETTTEDDLLVDLTLHGFPATLLAEFAQKIVRPYYNGNLNRALKELMEKALAEQQLLQSHVVKTTHAPFTSQNASTADKCKQSKPQQNP